MARLETGATTDKAPPDLGEGEELPEGDEPPEVFAPDPLVSEGVARGVEMPAGRVGVPVTPTNVRDDNGFPRLLQESSNSAEETGRSNCSKDG